LAFLISLSFLFPQKKLFMLKAIFSQKTTLLFLLFVGIFTVFAEVTTVFAQQGRAPVPPTFPTCQTKLSVGRGDRKSENSGLHPIPGKSDLEGRNDIYTLSEGNFIQCTCEGSGGRGVQTNWWNLQGLPLGRVDIDAYVRDGWIHINNGSGWDVLGTQYLAKTNDISCNAASAATQTPTPTRRPTINLTQTPTPRNSTALSSCKSLTVSSSRGAAPLTVRFTISGTDPNGQIQEYELDTGDVVAGEEEVLKQTTPTISYTFESPGIYNVSAWIKDSQGEWKESNACKKTITVSDTGIGGKGGDELPETGLSFAAIAAITGLATGGFFLRKHYRLI
jgi:hypothetical protein